jgi:hypothetical protein
MAEKTLAASLRLGVHPERVASLKGNVAAMSQLALQASLGSGGPRPLPFTVLPSRSSGPQFAPQAGYDAALPRRFSGPQYASQAVLDAAVSSRSSGAHYSPHAVFDAASFEHLSVHGQQQQAQQQAAPVPQQLHQERIQDYVSRPIPGLVPNQGSIRGPRALGVGVGPGGGEAALPVHQVPPGLQARLQGPKHIQPHGAGLASSMTVGVAGGGGAAAAAGPGFMLPSVFLVSGAEPLQFTPPHLPSVIWCQVLNPFEFQPQLLPYVRWCSTC